MPNIFTDYNQKAPFNFPEGLKLLAKHFKIHISIYAAHLYDSVMLYARALDTVIKEKAAEIADKKTDIHRTAYLTENKWKIKLDCWLLESNSTYHMV